MGEVSSRLELFVWGLVGVLEGAEKCQRYQRDAMGLVKPVGSEETCFPGYNPLPAPALGLS